MRNGTGRHSPRGQSVSTAVPAPKGIQRWRWVVISVADVGCEGDTYGISAERDTAGDLACFRVRDLYVCAGCIMGRNLLVERAGDRERGRKPSVGEPTAEAEGRADGQGNDGADRASLGSHRRQNRRRRRITPTGPSRRRPHLARRGRADRSGRGSDSPSRGRRAAKRKRTEGNI